MHAAVFTFNADGFRQLEHVPNCFSPWPGCDDQLITLNVALVGYHSANCIAAAVAFKAGDFDAG